MNDNGDDEKEDEKPKKEKKRKKKAQKKRKKGEEGEGRQTEDWPGRGVHLPWRPAFAGRRRRVLISLNRHPSEFHQPESRSFVIL